MNSLDLKPADAPAAPQLDRRGLDESQWRVLRDSVWPGASDKAIVLALDYCSARRIDPFKKPVHIVKVWSSAATSGWLQPLWRTRLKPSQLASCTSFSWPGPTGAPTTDWIALEKRS